MRSAADTNVLVRFVAQDDPVQYALAEAALRASGTIVVSNVVLCEFVWILHQAMKRSRADVSNAVRLLIATRDIELDTAAASAGIAMMDRGGDFSDGVVLLEASRARCDQLLTFDRRFAKIGGRVPVTLLSDRNA